MKNSHNHTLSENDILKIFLANKIKDLASNTAYSTHKVYSAATSSSKICELPIINIRTVYKTIQNIRKRNSIVVDSSRNLEELNITTLRDENFVVFDSGVDVNDRIVVLSTEKNLTHLQNSKVLICDGTFKVCPKEFLQLYVLHGKIHSNVYALVYILLTTKKEKDYLKAINIILDKCNQTFPEFIVIDFEVAAYIAFKKATKSTIYFCLFHFGQTMFRKLQKLGFVGLFIKNIQFRLFIKCVTSLAFVHQSFLKWNIKND